MTIKQTLTFLEMGLVVACVGVAVRVVVVAQVVVTGLGVEGT